MDKQTDRLHHELLKLDRQIGSTLRICIVFSIALILTGMVIFILKGGSILAGLVPLSSLYMELLKLNPGAFVTTAIIIILLMPVFIILTSFTHFIIMHERKPFLICIILLGMLAASFIFIWK